MEHLGTDRSKTAIVEDAYHAICTAKADGFMTIAVYDVHENKQQEVRELAELYLPDYLDVTSFWKFASLREEGANT